MTLTKEEIAAGMRRLSKDFMAPEVCHFGKAQTTDGPKGIIVYPDGGAPEEGATDEHGDDVWERSEAPGYYARLSAAGYMDCTDWSGPFETEADAEEYLVETFDDGEE